MRARFPVFVLSLCVVTGAFAQEGRRVGDARYVRDAPYVVGTVDESAQLRAVQQAIGANVVRVAGMDFPKALGVVAAGGTAQASCCTPGETRKRDVLFFKQYTGYNENKNKQYGPYKLVEGTNPCWVISAYQRVEMSAAGKYGASVSHQPAGFQLNQSETYTNEYQNARNYLLTLKLPKNVQASLEAKLNELVKNYSSASLSINTNMGTVQHTITLWGAGLGKGRSWYDGYVYITETCCPPELRDAAALRTTLKTWVDETAKKYKTYLGEPMGYVQPVN